MTEKNIFAYKLFLSLNISDFMITVLYNHLRDVPWEDIFKCGASAAAREFCE